MKTLTIREARQGLLHPKTLFADDSEVPVVRRRHPVQDYVLADHAVVDNFGVEIVFLAE